MAAISKLRINGFKAFPQECEIDFAGMNLLMYGENGSGKSSIYYALHALLQSQNHDKGNIYFDKNSSESLVNKYTISTEPYIELELEGGATKYRLSKNGYKEFPSSSTSPLRDMNAECVFINHKFLFHAFSFRNSQYIDLFPVFIKDILPFTLTSDQHHYISQLYDKIVAGIQRKGSRVAPDYDKLLDKFNREVFRIVEIINYQSNIHPETHVNSIYNKHFRDEGDRELLIELKYENNRDHIPQPDKSYWLRYGYKYQQIIIANRQEERKVGTQFEILSPVIRMIVKEKKEDGTWLEIEKPQTYFNEAKLTAIILSIRFSLLDLTADADGRFLALDDMLISLDMSNRAKVVKFLLGIADKYKIYLFTHDRAFFNYIWHEIQSNRKSQDWVSKRICYSKNDKMPFVLDDQSDNLSKAKYFYQLGDYTTSALYLRKQLEQSVGELLPYELKTRVDGGFTELQTLWKKLVGFYSCNGKSIDDTMQKLFEDSKLLILNVSAHYQRLSTPIYRNELDQVFKLVNYVKSLDKISNKLVVEGETEIVFTHPSKNYRCSFELDSDLAIIQDEHIVAKIPKCKNIKWTYNEVDYWDFVKEEQNNDHPLIASTPKLTSFFKSCCEKLPLGITTEMLMEHCKIDSEFSLKDFFGDLDLFSLSVKIS